MLIRINKALAQRREELKSDKGFTLIELLVVVIIIGILAAIAIPIYLGVQNSSKDAAVQSDITNSKIAVVAYETNNTSVTILPALTAAVLSSFGFTQSGNTSAIAYDNASTTVFPSFCIQGTGVTGTIFYVTDSVGVTKTKPAACA